MINYEKCRDFRYSGKVNVDPKLTEGVAPLINAFRGWSKRYEAFTLFLTYSCLTDYGYKNIYFDYDDKVSTNRSRCYVQRAVTANEPDEHGFRPKRNSATSSIELLLDVGESDDKGNIHFKCNTLPFTTDYNSAFKWAEKNVIKFEE